MDAAPRASGSISVAGLVMALSFAVLCDRAHRAAARAGADDDDRRAAWTPSSCARSWRRRWSPRSAASAHGRVASSAAIGRSATWSAPTPSRPTASHSRSWCAPASSRPDAVPAGVGASQPGVSRRRLDAAVGPGAKPKCEEAQWVSCAPGTGRRELRTERADRAEAARGDRRGRVLRRAAIRRERAERGAGSGRPSSSAVGPGAKPDCEEACEPRAPAPSGREARAERADRAEAARVELGALR